MEIPPQCPKDYKIKKSKCKCVPDVTRRAVPTILKSPGRMGSPRSFAWHSLKKCPKGSTRNKKTKKCEWRHGIKRLKNNKTLKSKKPTKKPTKQATRKPTKKPTKQATRKPTKQATRKPTKKPTKQATRKLGQLSPIKSIRITPAISTTPRNQQLLGDAIMDVYKSAKDDTKVTKKVLMSKLVTKSFSPVINQQLKSLKEGEFKGVLGCISSKGDAIGFNKEIVEFKKNPMVNIGTDNSPICYSYMRKESQDLMLKNLNTKININCANIITPKQISTNCWFNTLFVSLFISDKGRKFFRFFRTLMIKGIKADGKPITPVSLHKSFFLLNMLIEASFNFNNTSKNVALLMDTNELIKSIGMAIKTGWSKQGIKTKQQPKIPKKGQWGNPLSYYKNIMNYLNDKSVILEIITIDSNKKNIDYKTQDNLSWKTAKTIPEIVVGEIYDNDSIQKKLSFEINFKGQKLKYALDSVIIRDESKSHFCSLVTCNKKEYGFDGASFRHLEKMDWKNIINTNKQWNFRDGSHIKWNFMKGYMMLFYYRVK
jgi:hypothetical protein